MNNSSTKNGWINVKEKLPPPFVSVLVIGSDIQIAPCVASYSPEGFNMSKATKELYHWQADICCEPSFNNVKYWMFLPLPPQG